MPDSKIPIPRECRRLFRHGAVVAINSSGGKDSQVTILLTQVVPRDQFLILHATVGEVDWPGGAYRARDSAERAVHSGPIHIQKVPA